MSIPLDPAVAIRIAADGIDVPVRLAVGFVQAEIGTVTAGENAENVFEHVAGLLDETARQMRAEAARIRREKDDWT